MFQEDIFKLLLMVLLMANDGDGCDHNYGRINEILIFCMLLGAGNNNPCCRGDNNHRHRHHNECGCERNNRITTF
ncbi:MAG: hypothetical protein FWE13_04495 [Firmicutes bacterium]|nr:hypothetical protein [Bacillota bacterium]